LRKNAEQKGALKIYQKEFNRMLASTTENE